MNLERQTCNLAAVELLPNEVWAIILQYLDYVDILSIKFLSKRCFCLSFLSDRFQYFQRLAKQLVDCNVFYEKVNGFFKSVINESDVSFSNQLYMNYFFDKLMGDVLISSIFCHLFHCPRSLFTQSKCQLCSRRFVLTTIVKPDNFNELFNLNFNERLMKEYHNISFKGLESSLFYKSYDELVTVTSNKKRCLTTCVITTPAKIARLFLEVFLRILVNGCYDFATVLSNSKKLGFIQKYFDCLIIVLPNLIAKFDYDVFIKIFSENNYTSDIFKITNRNFLKYCSEKYAC